MSYPWIHQAVLVAASPALIRSRNKKHLMARVSVVVRLRSMKKKKAIIVVLQCTRITLRTLLTRGRIGARLRHHPALCLHNRERQQVQDFLHHHQACTGHCLVRTKICFNQCSSYSRSRHIPIHTRQRNSRITRRPLHRRLQEHTMTNDRTRNF